MARALREPKSHLPEVQQDKEKTSEVVAPPVQPTTLSPLEAPTNALLAKRRIRKNERGQSDISTLEQHIRKSERGRSEISPPKLLPLKSPTETGDTLTPPHKAPVNQRKTTGSERDAEISGEQAIPAPVASAPENAMSPPLQVREEQLSEILKPPALQPTPAVHDKPAVEVLIGRIEVYPSASTHSRKPTARPRAAPRQSLDDYLARRRR